jgi:ABC-type nitrate/sulfonate/bicarbonate transport system ATPase subunit
MTNAPGRVKEIVPVGLTRPRSYEMLSTPEFRNLHQTVLGSIRAESLRIAQIDDAALA